MTDFKTRINNIIHARNLPNSYLNFPNPATMPTHCSVVDRTRVTGHPVNEVVPAIQDLPAPNIMNPALQSGLYNPNAYVRGAAVEAMGKMYGSKVMKQARKEESDAKARVKCHVSDKADVPYESVPYNPGMLTDEELASFEELIEEKVLEEEEEEEEEAATAEEDATTAEEDAAAAEENEGEREPAGLEKEGKSPAVGAAVMEIEGMEPVTGAVMVEIEGEKLVADAAVMEIEGTEPISDAAAVETEGKEPVSDAAAMEVEGNESVSDAAAVETEGKEPVSDAAAMEVEGNESVTDAAAVEMDGNEPVTDAAVMEIEGMEPVSIVAVMEIEGMEPVSNATAVEMEGKEPVTGAAAGETGEKKPAEQQKKKKTAVANQDSVLSTLTTPEICYNMYHPSGTQAVNFDNVRALLPVRKYSRRLLMYLFAANHYHIEGILSLELVE
ncbi:hypothetical protein HO133_000804 [Letharia lupina]|uniref:Uncharacterized protein n=1 Tax=Letharia lupina TaxID=560253 RepID=A0A8H6FC72_9LECA|nr:uncharacterized protein HO133_000804 [Letharia lupina]KAF6222756.1 hypothetical protein HO133_000804 [Letharia lupina]